MVKLLYGMGFEANLSEFSVFYPAGAGPRAGHKAPYYKIEATKPKPK